MLATLAFVRRGELDDTFASPTILIDDPEDLVQKPVGACLREAGKQDGPRLLGVPRPTRGHDAQDGPAIRHRASRCRGHEPHYLGLRVAAATPSAERRWVSDVEPRLRILAHATS